LHADLDRSTGSILEPMTCRRSRPWSGLAVEESSRRRSPIAANIAISFFGLCAAAVTLSIVLR
jgi:hypothetical protein